jgi:malic enzyme
MVGSIIPSIIHALNAQSKTIKNHEVLICGPGAAEVTVNRFRYAVNLEQKTCSCRAWQVT